MKPSNCDWCGSEHVKDDIDVVYWELPDGTRAIEIHETPTIVCLDCHMKYQTEKMIKEIENQLYLINTKLLPKSMTYQFLMKQERILKRNYFDFS